jgi:glycosyltransferase involved in cell wall biosynthesis
MKDQPLVSVLILSMNHAPYIEKAIASIRDQKYRPIEIVYLDNISSDGTYEKGCAALKETGIPYSTYRNETSIGISKNLNFLLSHANGEYVTFLSTDDWLTPDSIKEKVAYFLQHPEFGMVYSSAWSYNYDTGITAINIKKKKFKEGWVLKEVLTENFVNTTGSMISSATLEKVGNFDENSAIEDWDMWIRIAEKFPIGLVNKELAYYGVKEGGNITGNIAFMNKGFAYILEKYKHYDEIREARKLVVEAQVYHYASKEPSFTHLLFILKNFRMNSFFIKQLGKMSINIFKKAFRAKAA